MDLPPDFPEVHSCALCDKLILDPRAGGLFEEKSRKEWATFDPELTVRDLREQRRHGCVFADKAHIDKIDDNTPVLYSLNPSKGGIPGFHSVTFGIPQDLDYESDTESGSEQNEIDTKAEFRPDDVMISNNYISEWTRDLLALPGNPACDIIPRTPINVKPGSNKSFELARKWYQTCINTHKECRGLGRGLMPKRVISIDRRQSGFHLRLHETEGSASEPYCALSYRWGGEQRLKTTTKTFHTFKAAIAFDKLPATIRDAITTTSELGLRYLFVDSLCIIQDDQDDIHSQIAQMSDYYSEATITILASRAYNVETGFLHERPQSLESPPHGNGGRPKDLWRYKGTSKMGIRCPTGEIGSVILIGSENGRSADDLRTRAWVLQEELLAPRTLEYGHDQTVWTCRSPHPLVDGWLDNSGWNKHLPEKVPDLLRLRLLAKAGEKTGNLENRKEILDLWHELVQNYSGRVLSEPNDKLLAIGAIAQLVGDAMRDDEYLAGIWKSTMPHDLFWGVWFSRYNRPKDFRAPSWSWAAIDGRIRMHSYDNDPCSLEVLEAHTNLAFPNAPLGAVTAGHLVVRGRVQEVELLDLDLEGKDFKGHFRVRENEGPEFMLPLSFDAAEQELGNKSQEPLKITLLEMYGAGEVTRSGLVLRNLDGHKFSRLGLFSWEFEPEYYDETKTRSEEDQDLYWEWVMGFDECDTVEITLI